MNVLDAIREADKCNHVVSGKINEIGELLMFCELTGNFENVTLGECIGNCESQKTINSKIAEIEQSIECSQCGWRSPDNCRVCRADRERGKNGEVNRKK